MLTNKIQNIEINESQAMNNWGSGIVEQLGNNVSPQKKKWMSILLEHHSIFESGGTATPNNTLGAGDIVYPDPSNGQSLTNPGLKKGSGDTPTNTLSMAFNVASYTVGMDIVDTIPMTSQSMYLTYMDSPYGTGKINSTDAPIYIKFSADEVGTPAFITVLDTYNRGDVVYVYGGDGEAALKATYMGTSRVLSQPILKIDSLGVLNTTSGVFTEGTSKVSTVFVTAVALTKDDGAGAADVANSVVLTSAKPDLVQSNEEHIDGFANFDGVSKSPMTRGENETGTGNSLGLRMCTLSVEAQSYEVTGQVTRQQLQDYPHMGIDVMGFLRRSLQNQIIQSINKRILERVFRLGVKNAAQLKRAQGVDFNLFVGPSASASKDLSAFGLAEFVDTEGNDQSGLFTGILNAETNSSAENLSTRQRKIMSKMMAASYFIGSYGRRGAGNTAVVNAQVAAALEDASLITMAPTINTFSQTNDNVHFVGMLGRLNVYMDPNMHWTDTRINVSLKGDNDTPGVKFMPYILADTVETIAESTMAPKVLTNTRYALVDAGYYPEKYYYTFGVNTGFNSWV